jgi:hypothetical protein
MSDAYYSSKYMKGEYAQCDDCSVMVFPPRKGIPNQCECTPNKSYNKLESAYELIMAAEKKTYADTKSLPKGSKSTPFKNKGMCQIIEVYVQHIYDDHNDKWNPEWGADVEEALVKFSAGYDNPAFVPSKNNWKAARNAEITNDKMDDFIKAMNDVADV